MDRTSRGLGGVRNSSLGGASQGRQAIRAWVLLIAGFVAFLAMATTASVSVHSYLTDVNQPRTATLEPVSGQSLLLRSDSDSDWRLVTDRTEIQEGDTISTGSATAGWITLFDQGTVEISEDSLVRIPRMRTSRMFREQKLIEIEPIRGTVYIGMAPRDEFNASEVRVQTDPATITMRDEIRGEPAGSFLVETQRLDPSGDEEDPVLSVRAAVLRGEAVVDTGFATQRLRSDQQAVIDASGNFGDITPAMRQLIRNGDFERHLADWVEYHDHSGDGSSVSGAIERVPVETPGGASVAVQIARSTTEQDNWESGIQQSIGQSLRVHSSLNLEMEIRIDEQKPLGGGEELTEFPLIVKLSYVDLQGQNREWWHGFYIFDDPSQSVPEDRATRVPRSEWVPISLDLRGLSPLPRQISSVTIYSSGHGYRSMVSDVSLTSSETGDDEYD